MREREKIARHYLRQARAKMRMIADREMREWLSGERDVLPGCTLERETLDAIWQAYKAGMRAAALREQERPHD